MCACGHQCLFCWHASNFWICLGSGDVRAHWGTRPMCTRCPTLRLFTTPFDEIRGSRDTLASVGGGLLAAGHLIAWICPSLTATLSADLRHFCRVLLHWQQTHQIRSESLAIFCTRQLCEAAAATCGGPLQLLVLRRLTERLCRPSA